MKKVTKNLTLLILLAICAFAKAEQNGSGLQISAAADIGGQFGLHQGSGASDRIDPREAEILLFAPIDHLFEGNLSFAGHYEGGNPQIELHEAFVGSTKLIPRSRFRVGQFFLGIGRLNQFHRHDWPFMTAPKVHRTFFAEEGALDTGAEYSYLLPVPFFLEITAGITNGYVFGHSHAAGVKPYFPTHYLRLANYQSLPGNGGMQIGLNYLGRKSETAETMTLLGIDLTAKWKEGAVLNFLLQSEVWYRIESPRGGMTKRAIGAYVFPQYYIGENLFAGVRVDYFSHIAAPDATGATSKNFDLDFVPTLTYKPSEFSTMRLVYNHNLNYMVDHFTDSERYVELQAIFILGAHPAHDF